MKGRTGTIWLILLQQHIYYHSHYIWPWKLNLIISHFINQNKEVKWRHELRGSLTVLYIIWPQYITTMDFKSNKLMNAMKGASQKYGINHLRITATAYNECANSDRYSTCCLTGGTLSAEFSNIKGPGRKTTKINGGRIFYLVDKKKNLQKLETGQGLWRHCPSPQSKDVFMYVNTTRCKHCSWRPTSWSPGKKLWI